MTTLGGGGATSAPRAPAPPSYINFAAPRPEPSAGDDAPIDEGGGQAVEHPGGALAEAHAVDRMHPAGNPIAARRLEALEAEAQRTGKNPKEINGRFKDAKQTQEARLLTILVEFNDAANDDFTGTTVPATVFENRRCEPGTIQNGPLHNQIPNPANASHPDNNTMWVSDFSPEHYSQMLFTTEGIADRVRTDLPGPDGALGFDISGYTMKNLYEEMSKGAYTITGSVRAWVIVPHSEGWYGASRCARDANGELQPPVPQAMQGHPDNPHGPATLAIDAVDAVAAAQPDFPWADYDIEDQGDVDGDGNLLEPDGVIDHLVLVHAGEDKSRGGGAQGVYAIWQHNSVVPGGYAIPGTSLELSNYSVLPEDAGVGAFAHEHGHELGLPDLIDISGIAESGIDFWDLMASGANSGPIFQSIPTHMGLWGKWVLGWADPLQLEPGDDPRDVIVGQTSRTPKGTKDGIKVNLPPKPIDTAETRQHYYLIEWRNYDGFDEGLRHAYDTSYDRDDAWKVEKIAYNAPGALVWYRDTTYGNTNDVGRHTFELPSTGSKGAVLIVDSHFEPLRRQGEAAVKDPSTLNNLPSRPQSSNAAFGLVPTKPFRECYEAAPTEPFSEYCTDFDALPAVDTFTDELTWYPGVEHRNGVFFFRDLDTSAVVPSVGNAPYTTRIVDADGNALPELYGVILGSNNLVLGSGNPDDEGASFHTKFQVVETKNGNTAAKIHVVPPTP